jgi:hypothetical protein
MQEERFAPIREGMTVEDADGDKVGTVGKIYQPASVSSTASSTTAPAGELFLKVDTGFLGLGKDRFIPASAIRNVTGDRVILTVDKDRVDEMGWDVRPTWIED